MLNRSQGLNGARGDGCIVQPAADSTPSNAWESAAVSLSRDDVEKVALLARLKLTESEVDALTGELQSVLQYVDQLAQVDTDGVEPMAHAVELQNVLREDAVEPSLPRSDALANAPKHNDAGYLVPAVLGD